MLTLRLIAPVLIFVSNKGSWNESSSNCPSPVKISWMDVRFFFLAKCVFIEKTLKIKIKEILNFGKAYIKQCHQVGSQYFNKINVNTTAICKFCFADIVQIVPNHINNKNKRKRNLKKEEDNIEYCFNQFYRKIKALILFIAISLFFLFYCIFRPITSLVLYIQQILFFFQFCNVYSSLLNIMFGKER